ncbi:DUF1178 family protein [Marinovum sp.]|uniref:DUF1178 family protein n=1 Tax=Marinovum sp. TaxID=2024839 RepID=UPI002B266746|nr:DUF1178 family protein [Marinovum sp.]
MIHYALKCSEDHRFESWFQSAAAFDKLQAAGMVACAVCGTSAVDRDLMAPRVSHGSSKPAPAPAKPLSTPASPAEKALADLKAHIEKTSEDVGRDFAREARAIHLGEAPSRAIRGEAKPEEARKLVEDGVPIAPLPFRVGRKSN